VKIGAWIHSGGGISLEEQIALAAENDLRSIRCYHYGYAEEAAPAIRQNGMSLLAGMSVNAEALVQDWRSQVRLDELARYHELGIPLEAICVGNELREGGDEPDRKRFTARLSFGLANVLDTYRHWLDEHGFSTPLTYAMEGIVLDSSGNFHEWLWPLIDACDIVSVNLYPMGNEAWFTFAAFEESRRFLCDRRTRNDRLATFEFQLRHVLQQLEELDKPLLLSETGFPSAVGYHFEGELEGKRLVVPETDPEGYRQAMGEFINLIHRANEDYNRRIRSLYFYEWRDNLYHSKIWNVEQSPIHVAFGLCDRSGKPKFDIKGLVHNTV